MSHPRRFDDNDPVLARVRALAADFPDAAEKVSHGNPAFFTTRVFAYFGGSEQQPGGGYRRHAPSLLVKTDPAERPALLERADTYLPMYLGPSGWVGFDLPDDTDWAEIAELLDASYRLTAGPRRVAALDART